MVEIEIPSSVRVQSIETKDLPDGWDAIPHQPGSQHIGDDLVHANKFAVLKVPSVVVKGDYNYLINPRHPDFRKIKIKETSPFFFDPRIIR